jgi:hypothetical protein
VQRTCAALDAHGFTAITTLEVLLRAYEVAAEAFHTHGAGFIQPNKASRKRRHGGDGEGTGGEQGGDGGAAAAAALTGDGGSSAEQQQQQRQQQQLGGGQPQQQQQQQQPGDGSGVVQRVMARPTMEARGHTGYLTFAHKFVAALPLGAGSGESDDGGADDDAGDGGDGGDDSGSDAGGDAPGEHARADAAVQE